MSLWTDKLSAIFRKYPEAAEIRSPQMSGVKLCRVIKEFDGSESVVATGLTLTEAERFVRAAGTKMKKIHTPDTSGEAQFEMVRFTIKEECHG